MSKTPYIIVTCTFFVWILRAYSVGPSPGTAFNYRSHPVLAEADSFFYQGKWEEALIRYRSMTDHNNEEVAPRAHSLYALNRMTEIYVEKGDLNKAQRISEAVSAIFTDTLWRLHSEYSNFLFSRARVLFSLPVYDENQIFTHIQRSLTLRMSGEPTNHMDIGRSQLLLARYYARQKWTDRALIHFEAAIKSLAEVGSVRTIFLARVYYHYAESLGEGLEVEMAIGFMRKAIALFGESEGTFFHEISQACIALAKFLVEQKRYRQAIAPLRRSIDLIKRHQGPEHPLLSEPLYHLAGILGRDGDEKLAGRLFEKAISINREHRHPDSSILRETYLHYAEFVMNHDNPALASKILNKAVRLMVKVNTGPSMDDTRLKIALAWSRAMEGHRKEALNILQHAITDLEPNFQQADVHFNPDIQTIRYVDQAYVLLFNKAQICFLHYEKSTDLASLYLAYQTYQLLDALVNKHRTGPYSEATKVKLAADYRHLTEHAVEVIYELYDLTREDRYVQHAFEMFEKSRYSKVLANLLRLRKNDVLSVPDSLILLERRLIEKRAALNRQRAEYTDLESRIRIEQQIFELDRSYEHLVRFMHRRYPALSTLSDSDGIRIATVQSHLSRGEQILEYLDSENAWWVISITRDEASINRLMKSENNVDVLSSFLKRLTFSLNSPDDRADFTDYGRFAHLGYSLYAAMVNPFLDEQTRILIVSPDGDLSKLPFECLLTSKGPGNYRNAPYLFKKLQLRYTFNSTLLLESRPRNPERDFKILALSHSADTSLQDTLPGMYLPFVYKEVGFLKEHFGSRAVTDLQGKHASEASFKKRIEESDIIHLAVHGTGDTTRELNSHLIFWDGPDNLDDGKLYAYELYGENLKHVRLTVLSACESGLGKNRPGEGVMSVARGFAYAGCPSVVMSLWKVDDRSTFLIMRDFYRNLERGDPTEEALHHAKLSFIGNLKNTDRLDPYYWAGLIPIGQSHRVFPQSPPFLRVLLYLLIASGIWYIWQSFFLVNSPIHQRQVLAV